MKCNSCGEEIRDTARFCGFCGADQTVDAEGEMPTMEPIVVADAEPVLETLVPEEDAIMDEEPITEIPELEIEPATEPEIQEAVEPVAIPMTESAFVAEPEPVPDPIPETVVVPEPIAEPAPVAVPVVETEPVAEPAPVIAPQPEPQPAPAPVAPVAPPVAAPAPQPVVAPAPQPVYQAPQPVYQAPQPVYQAPQPQYQAPQPVYQAPQPQYQAPQPVYQAPQPQYQAPQPVYQAPQPQYQAPQPVYQAPQPQYQPRPQYQPAPQPQYQPRPAQQPMAQRPVQQRPAYQLPTGRGLIKLWLLTIITLGIYPMVMWSRMSVEINMVASRYDGKRTMHFLWMPVVAALTLGIYMFVWLHQQCNRIGNELKRRQVNYKFSAATFWLWTFVYGIVGGVVTGVVGFLLTSLDIDPMISYAITAVLGLASSVGSAVFGHKILKAFNLMNADYNEKG